MSTFITKRKGEKAVLNTDKILATLQRACLGIPHVDPQVLFEYVVKHIYEGITSKDIETLLITSAETFIERSPEYGYVAAQLFLTKIQKEVIGQSIKDKDVEQHYRQAFKDSIGKGIDAKILDPRMGTTFDLDFLADCLEIGRDNLLDYMGIQVLYERYFTKVGEVRMELPQIFWMRVAMGLSLNEKDPNVAALRLYSNMSNLYAVPSTPTLFHSGFIHSQMASCLTEGSTILTSDGLKNIEDVSINDYVLTENGEYNRVQATQKRIHDDNILKFNIVGIGIDSSILSVTPEHPVKAIRRDDVKCCRTTGLCLTKQGDHKNCYPLARQYKDNCRKLTDDFKNIDKFIRADELSPGDYVEITFPTKVHNKRAFVMDFMKDNFTLVDGKVFKLKNDVKRKIVNGLSSQTLPVNNEIVLDGDFGRFIGYYLSQGHISSNVKMTCLTFNSGHDYFIQDAVNIVKSKFGLTASIVVNKDNSTCVEIHSTIVARFLMALVGTGFNTKKLSQFFLESNQEFTKGVLIGVCRGDGCTHEAGLTLQLSNKYLICQLFLLSLKSGLLPTINKGHMPSSATEQPYYIFFANGPSDGFIKEVGKNLDRRDPIKQSFPLTRSFILNGKAYYQIDSITKEQFSGTVYDLQVENDPSFSANLICVHNCYLGTVQDDLRDIFKVVGDNAQMAKYSGGIGTDVTNIRAMGAFINTTKVESQGIVPFLKIMNDTTLAINRSGKRRGAAAVYLENWHYDVEDFIDLKRNTGDERRRTHDLNTALWISDLFIQRVEQNANWTLFSPEEVPDLHHIYGKAFRERYEHYEQLAESGKIRLSRVVKAKALWRKMLTSLFETGGPWTTFKCTSNVRSPQDHVGVIHNSNLCCEILENNSKDEVAVCNLASLNLGSFVSYTIDGEAYVNFTLLEEVIKTTVRGLDNVIDLNFYPIPETKTSNMRHRPIGMGLMGWQDMLFKLKVPFDSPEAIRLADGLMEFISYHAISTSADLSEEKGAYSTFKGSKWDRGIFPIDSLALLETERGEAIDVSRESLIGMDWAALKNKVKQVGMRNSLLMAVAPTACVHEDTLITTDKGLVRIGDLDENGEEWQDIDFSVHQENSVQQATKLYRNGVKPIIELTTKRGQVVKSTFTHKYRVVDENGDYVWKVAKDIQIGDGLVKKLSFDIFDNLEYQTLLDVDYNHQNSIPTTLPLTLDEATAEMLGYYMGDGYLHSRDLGLIVSDEDSDLLQYWEKYYKDAFNREMKIERKPISNVTMAWIHSVKVKKWFEINGFCKEKGNKGEGSASAFVPDQILKSPSSVMKAFIRGFFEAEGTVCCNGAKHKNTTGSFVISCTCVSENIIRTMSIMLDHLGIRSTIGERPPGTLGNRPAFCLTISSLEDAKKFVEEIGFISNRKKEKSQTMSKGDFKYTTRNITIANQALIDDFVAVCRSQGDELDSETVRYLNVIKSQGNLNIAMIRKIDKMIDITSTKLYYYYSNNLEIYPVTQITESQGMTYDISVPVNNTYIANGFISHNTIGNIVGAYPCIEPIYKNIYTKSNRNGEFTIINKYLVGDLRELGLWSDEMLEKIKSANGSIQHIREIPKKLRDLYKEAFEIDAVDQLKLTAVRGKWIDQSQSHNVFLPAGVSGKTLSNVYLTAWRMGLKTTYYLRTLGASQIEKATTVKPQEVQACSIDNPDCESCQ